MNANNKPKYHRQPYISHRLASFTARLLNTGEVKTFQILEQFNRDITQWLNKQGRKIFFADDVKRFLILNPEHIPALKTVYRTTHGDLQLNLF